MNNTIKYNVAVAIIMIATAFSACKMRDDSVVTFEEYEVSLEDETTQGKSPQISGEESNVIKAEIPEIALDSTGDQNSLIMVYVCGAVGNPNVYELPEGSRIVDAVELAGGFGEDAGIDFLNLATVVYDGQKVYIPTKAEVEDALESGVQLFDTQVKISPNSVGSEYEIVNGADLSAQSGETVKTSSGSGGLVNINTADAATLTTLPGIGTSKAEKIIAFREENGKFSSIEDIMLIAGIKEGLFNKVKDRICVE